MALYLIPYTLLAQGVYTGIIGTISAVTMGTVSVCKSIYTHQNPDVTKTIKELDIERRLNLIQAVLNKIDDHSKKDLARMKMDDLEKTQIFEIVGGELDLQKDPIELCILYIHETIQNIHNDLTAINKKIAYHNTKWFNSWRTLNIQGMLENLRLNSNLLNSRFDDLTKISIFLSDRR